jgi:hypothetical protein
MTIGTRAIWGAKLSRSPLYDISVSWINFEKPAALIVTLRTDYQPVFFRHDYVLGSHAIISSITSFCCNAITEMRFSTLPGYHCDKKTRRLSATGFCSNFKPLGEITPAGSSVR